MHGDKLSWFFKKKEFLWKEFLYETRKLQGEENATSTAPPPSLLG